MGEKEGPLVEHETGKKIGTHRGYWYYTIGQRQGLGLAGGPWFVTAKNHHDNTVFISRMYYAQDKMRDTFKVVDCNWIAGEPSRSDLEVKMRHGPAFNQAHLTPLADGNFRVQLAVRDQGIAQGQYAAFYEGTRCLGSGMIELL